MAPVESTWIDFIDSVLSCTNTLLSYTDPDQKWIIRNHLISLVQEFPTFTPFVDTFTHNDGATSTILHAAGDLNLPNSLPQVHATIWVHENYPSMPPLVFVTSKSSDLSIRRDHPFIEPSDSSATTPYLLTWQYPPCNLAGVVKNLVNIFSCDHPFVHASTSSLGHSLLVSKKEAIDRLVGMLYYDMEVLNEMSVNEMDELFGLQAEMLKRVDVVTSVVLELEHEKMNLKERVRELDERGDVLINWLKVHDFVGHENERIVDAFEADDEKSRVLVECLSADKATEDLMYAMDRAVGQGVVSMENYMKQVRSLAREQFYNRHGLVQLLGYFPNCD